MKRCTFDTNIITAFLKNDLSVVEKVSDYLDSIGISFFIINMSEGQYYK
jgi:hypothetical protein